MSMLGIAKLFKVSDVAILKGIRAFPDTTFLPTEPAEVIQIDEMWHFVNRKKPFMDLERPQWDIVSRSRMAIGWP